MEVKIGIYKITSPTGKIYIGRSTNIHKRWVGYRVDMPKKQTRLYYSFRKHGVSAHQFEIVEECEKSALNEREIYYINLFNTCNTDHGLNLTAGGEGLLFVSEETRKKIGDFHRGHKYNLGKVTSEETKNKLREIGRVRVFTDQHRARLKEAHRINPKKLSDETIDKIKAARALQVSPMKGRKHSNETKEKIRKKKLGSTHSAEAKEKVSRSLVEQYKNGTRTGKVSPETAKKMSEKMKESYASGKRIAPMLNKKHSIEVLVKMSEKKIRIPCIQVSLDGFIVNCFGSQHEAARETKIRVGTINKCIKGRIKKAGGYIFL